MSRSQQSYVVALPVSPSTKSQTNRGLDESSNSKASKPKSSLKSTLLKPFRSSGDVTSQATQSNVHSLVKVPQKQSQKQQLGGRQKPGDPMPGVRMTFV
ncbi:hypothetical protein M408DRAFT_90587 [Serendipita vermifera MAFF 305830]|uniref:Uncharacterized protein n=1 Tax=Serendipita vermifera MAFF 305830 TaxID=933852 RepID=A0A0C2X7V6_SERVB|nr:hypothetical protein M408DRAFT_90587 [Serendipita vermifera MAFF 305830]